MELDTFPPQSRMRWRRIDVPGYEDATLERSPTGFRLSGRLEMVQADANTRLRYAVDCDSLWRTRSALVEGEVSERPFRRALTADGAGSWMEGDVRLPRLAGALDVDFGFTPATNTLPLRRLRLAVGQTAAVQSAWLRFPELEFDLLVQTYTRESWNVFRYRAMVDGQPFEARLDTDSYGRVVRYDNLWEVQPV